ncbi:ABC transporter ATP-binding protein [Halococcus salifodinae]|uniref:ABC transporter ATP-binding protein n=1 Tax=Halococcus salifodinae TaxID=36738 RepID=UPI003F83E67D
MVGNTEEGGPMIRLDDVVFAYDSGLDLSKVDSAVGNAESVPDPDARDGPVLRGVDLELPAGAFTVVMGASGGGKSTLLRTLNAIIPDFMSGSFAGDVTVLGRDTTEVRVSEMAEVVGMVLQDYESQLFGTNATAEVAFGPENLAVPPDEISDRIEHALELVGLADLDRRRSPDTLSGGQKQRLVIAGVVANQPRLLLLDEPTSDLDPAGSRDTLQVIRSLAAENDGTNDWAGPENVVMVSHNVEEALLADRIVLLRDGQVYRHGPTKEVFTDVEALHASRVAVPPVVETFDRLGWPADDLPLTIDDAARHVAKYDLDWMPPGVRDEQPPGAPAETGESPGDPIFEFVDLVHEYDTDQGTVRAVDGVDLTVRKGEAVAIVGHNGSGKTTLAKHFNGLLAPDAGSATWRGRDVASLPMAEVGRSIGYVFQNPDHQIFADTVRDEVTFGPENFGLEGEELEQRVATAIETVELDGLEEADPFTLSKGQRQRVALASILATEPDVIVFDEPTTGLDATQQRQFMDLVARLNREEGMTVVMITHNMNTVVRYAPRTVVMDDGRKVADRPTRELFADEDALEQWQLKPPQPVALSNRLAADAEIDGALPALSVDEVVSGLGGDGVFDNTDARATMDEGESGSGEKEESPATSGTDPMSDGSDDR